MYPNPNPNSNPNPSQPQHSTTGRQQLTRYGSAPSSVFDSSEVFLGMYSSSQPHSNTNNNSSNNSNMIPGFGIPASGGVTSNPTTTRGVGSSSSTSMQQSLPSSSLTRHNSSPAGFLTQLTASSTGFTLTNGGQSYGNLEAHKPSRFGTQLNFTNQPQESSSLKRAPSLQSTSFDFGGSSSKRGKIINGDIDLLSSFSDINSQMDLSEMTGTIDNMMNIPENSVACKTRAKRGFATHPRSIAERDRRTRISGRLKKLQELVPNMDKQTSYSEMLDLAIQHIQGLQFQIQKLNDDANKCTCGCKPKN